MRTLALALAACLAAQAQIPSAGAALPGIGSISSPAPQTFLCPNDGTTGTTNGQLVKFSASGTCINMATTDAGVGGITAIGVVVSGGGTTGSATVAPFGTIVNCVFDNAATFSHWVSISPTTAGNCHDSASNSPYSSGANNQLGYVGVSIQSGSAGTLPIVAFTSRNPFAGGFLSSSTTQAIGANNNGEFMIRTAAGGAGIQLKFGGAAATNPCLGDSGFLLKVLQAATNCTGGDGVIGAGHFSSDNAAPPTIASGFGTSPSVVSGGDAAFIVNVGTGGTATSGVMNFGISFTTAPACMAQDVTNNVATRVTASTTQATITAASAWTASDKVVVHCFGQNGL